MKIKLFSLLAIALMFSCTTEEEKPAVVTEKPGTKTEFEILFSETEFDKPEYGKLLKELKICTEAENPECPRCAVCSPKFFKVIELKKAGSVNDFFGLQIKTHTILNGQEFALPSRHLIIFERENGELVKVNGYRGNLIETIASESGVDDLMIRFLMKQEDVDTKKVEDVWFHCLFKWNGKRYNYESVEKILGVNWGGPVKAEFKKETSADVYDDLIEGDLIIKELLSQ